MAHVSAEADPRAQTAMELTHLMVQKHYCENDPEAVIAQMDEDFLWFGAGEQEYLAGKSAVAETFRQFVGQVPRCNISDEEYHVICIAPDAYVCTGRMWIATDPAILKREWKTPGFSSGTDTQHTISVLLLSKHIFS